MRISDWSSDVCSSDLQHAAPRLRWSILPTEAPGRIQSLSRSARRTVELCASVRGPCRSWSSIQHQQSRARKSPHGHMSALQHQPHDRQIARSEEHTSELQSLMRISYAVFCLKKKNNTTQNKKKIYYPYT